MRHFSPINLDANASHGILPEVWEGICGYPNALWNPSSIHQGGQKGRALIEDAREELSKLLGLSHSHTVIFTSGATEANNTALRLPFIRNLLRPENPADAEPAELIVTPYEHPSVLEAAKTLEAEGVRVKRILPSRSGDFDKETFLSNISNRTKMVSIMLANNETGEILPVPSLAKSIRELAPDVIIHSDVVQALGKLEFTFSGLSVDLVSISGHKIGALSGVGALIVSKRLLPAPFLVGGPQEQGWRAGTENILGIVSLGIAARVVRTKLKERIEHVRSLTKSLRTTLSKEIKDAAFHIEGKECLPNTISVRIPGVLADDLVVALDLEGVFVSSGAACASGKPEPSHVLLAMGLSASEAKETLRISLPLNATKEDIARAGELLVGCIKKAKGI